MTTPLANLSNPNSITTDGSTVDASAWTIDWSTLVNYINNSLTASFNRFENKGDIMCYDGTNIQALGVGANGTFLQANSAAPYGVNWVPAVTLASLTTKGDTLYYNAGYQRLPIGTLGQVLEVDTTGLPAWKSGLGLSPGMIVIWSGAIAAIPANWALCDGVHNTSGINLQGLFVVGAGNQSPGATGGMGLMSPGGPFGDNSAGAGLGPAHTHSVTSGNFGEGSFPASVFYYNNPATVTPKYYSLCYIEYQGQP